MASECRIPNNPLEFVGETMPYYRCITASVCQGQVSDFFECCFVAYCLQFSF